MKYLILSKYCFLFFNGDAPHNFVLTEVLCASTVDYMSKEIVLFS